MPIENHCLNIFQHNSFFVLRFSSFCPIYNTCNYLEKNPSHLIDGFLKVVASHTTYTGFNRLFRRIVLLWMKKPFSEGVLGCILDRVQTLIGTEMIWRGPPITVPLLSLSLSLPSVCHSLYYPFPINGLRASPGISRRPSIIRLITLKTWDWPGLNKQEE